MILENIFFTYSAVGLLVGYTALQHVQRIEKV